MLCRRIRVTDYPRTRNRRHHDFFLPCIVVVGLTDRDFVHFVFCKRLFFSLFFINFSL